MTLLNAPVYDEKRETLKKNLMYGIPIALLLLAVITLAGAFLGHGYFFVNLPAEHHVKVFLGDCQAGDYDAAYGVWMNDANWKQHPEKYDYKFPRFKEDWTTASDWHGPVTSFHVDVSKRNESGTVVAATVNNSSKRLSLMYLKDGTLTFSPMEIQY